MKFCRRVPLTAFLVALILCNGARADEAALTELRNSFADRIGRDLTAADLYLSGAGKLDLAEIKANTKIPDNEPLILHLTFTRDKISGNQDVYSIKRNHRLLLSLSDFALATGLPITVKPDGTATGSLNRQSQIFSLDANKHTIVIQGKTSPVDMQDISVENNDILISTDQLIRWFGLTLNYDFANLAIEITTSNAFPVEQAYERSKKFDNRFNSQTPATLPYQENEYALVSLPYIDTNINARAIRGENLPTQKFANISTILTGDFLGYNTQGFISGHADKPYLDTVRLVFTKEDLQGRLLGPLHAKKYQSGDVDTVSSPIIGGGTQEQGFYASSRLTSSLTTETVAPLHGDAPPGWDVELYRNNIYIDIRHVGADGLYDFGNVDLAVGDNDFKFVFYGPQGEQREEHRHIGVTSGALAAGTGDYEISATRKGLMTWQRIRPVGEDIGTPHLAGRYQYGVGGLGTVSAGAEASSTDGKYGGLVSGGLATYFLNTFFNTDLGYNLTSNTYSGVVTARRNFGSQSAFTQYTFNSPGFNTNNSVVGAQIRDSFRLNVGGPLFDQVLNVRRLNYSVNGNYVRLYDGGTQLAGGASLSGSFKSVLFATSLQYSQSTTTGTISNNFLDTTTTGLSGSANMHGFLYGGSWNADADYAISPIARLTNTDIDYTHSIGEKIDATARLGYQPDPELLTASLGLNILTSKATISPSLSYNSRHTAILGVNLHLSAGADPYSNQYTVSNKYLSDVGGVAARIFRDNNGSGEYDDGDEPLPGVIVKALQEYRNATSNTDGIAFIPDLVHNLLTDIIIDPATFPDSYDVTLFEGVSIRPHPGAVTKLDFPVVTAGEMDGQANYTDSDGKSQSARNLKVSLIAPDGRVEKVAVAASDGYWSLSTIRPGIYYLTADAASGLPGFMLPQLLEFKVNGTNQFGQKINLSSSRNISFHFFSVNPAPDGPHHARVILPSDIIGQQASLRLGPFHSRLAMTLAWYRLKFSNKAWRDQFTLANSLDSSEKNTAAEGMTLNLQPKKPLSMDQAAMACQGLDDLNLGCAVDVVTTYRGTIPPPPPPEPKATALVAAAVPAPVTRPAEAGTPLIVVRPKTAIDTSAAVIADLRDYAATNPALHKDLLKTQTVILNLGSYNSRALMGLMWYKIKTRYGPMIGNARLLVQPSESEASAQTGKHVLRVALPDYNVDDATKRCQLLQAQNQDCTVEILPAGLQSLTAVDSSSKG